jgi:hypothetical protein
MKRLKNGHRVPQLYQIACHCKTRGPSPHDSNLLPGWRGFFRQFQFTLAGFPIRKETFQAADSDLAPFLNKNTLCFALLFLRANTPAYRRKAVLILQDPDSHLEIFIRDTLDKSGNVDFHRATRNTHGLFTLETSPRFRHGCCYRVSESDLIKILFTHFRRLLDHRPSV